MATDVLRSLLNAFGFYDEAVPYVARCLTQAPEPRVVDLCSGGSGPWLRLQGLLEREVGHEVAVVLSDKFPSLTTFRWLRAQSGGRLEHVEEPVDATDVPEGLTGVRTLFSPLHHLPPALARQVLGDAHRRRAPIAVFEMTERSLPMLVAMVLFTPVFFLVAPFVRPFRPARLFWSWIVPAVPLTLCWDGLVSCLRTYSLTLPGREALRARLAAEEPATVVEAARRVLEEAGGQWEGGHLVELLAELGEPAYVDLALDAFAGSWEGEGLSDFATTALARGGATAEAALLDRWSTLEHDVDDRPTDLLAVPGGPRAVELTLAGIEGERADCDALARWARLACVLGDARPARPLARELHRGIDDVDRAVAVLDALHGLELPGAAEARERAVRRHGSVVESELVCCECGARHGEEDEDDELRHLRGVVLRCQACGETNPYDLDRVYATRGEPEPYLGDDLACRSCAARERLTSTTQGAGQLRLAVDRGAHIAARVDVPGRGRVGVAEAVRWWQALVEEQPDDVRALAGLGHVLARFGPPSRALATLERCLALDALCVEAALDLARVRQERGDEAGAFAPLDPLLGSRQEWHLFGVHDTRPAEVARALLAQRNELASQLGFPLLTTAALPDLARKRKVGRNEPCPCGSGKKHKKCCGRPAGGR